MTTHLMKHIALALSLTLVAAVATGCKHKKEPEVINTGGTTTTSNDGGYGEGGLNANAMNVTNWTKASDLAVVYFDYDSDALRPDAMAALARNAETMKAKPSNTFFRVEGHCDERGTQEYNVALGERRALAVRSHLISLGVGADRIITVSYGEEMPAVPGSGEAAWSQNRRAEFSVGTL